MAAGKLRGILDEFWAWRMVQYPEFGYLVGWKGTDHRGKLQSHSPAVFETRKAKCEDFLKRVKEISGDLSDAGDLLNADCFREELQSYVEGHVHKAYMFPINYLEGVQHELPKLVNEWLTYNTADDYETLLKIYSVEVPRQLDELIELMRQGIGDKIVLHAVSVADVVGQFDSLLNKPLGEQPLLGPVRKFPGAVGEVDRARFETEITKAVEEKVLPGLKKLRDFIEDEYAKNTRPNLAASTLPTPGFYEACLKQHTGTDLTPKQVHDIGLKEVARIQDEMRQIIKEVGSEDDLRTFIEKLRSDPKFYCKSEAELVKLVEKLCGQIEQKIPTIFHELPGMKMDIRVTPPEESGGPGAMYIAGTPDGSRPGVYYINALKFATQPTYELMSLSLHEGNPGHHLQSCFLIEAGNVPEFRQYLEDRMYATAPSRFPFHTAYVEGWGLYSETLGHDLGLYDDPYDRFGQLSNDMFRACRLVVDTGLHAFGWSADKAVEFMFENSAMTRRMVEAEVRRYITWPGQACAYKIGQLKFLDLRKKAESALGDMFSLKDFHQVVLQSYGPMFLTERAVEAYIQKTKAVRDASA